MFGRLVDFVPSRTRNAVGNVSETFFHTISFASFGGMKVEPKLKVSSF